MIRQAKATEKAAPCLLYPDPFGKISQLGVEGKAVFTIITHIKRLPSDGGG